MKRGTILTLLVAIGLAGCGAHPKPELSVQELSMQRSEDGGAVINLLVRAENAGEEPLPLGPATYALSINGQPAYAGTWLARATAPADGFITFTLPAPIDAARLPAPGASASYALSGTIEYVPPGALGEALFDARIRRGSATFRETGELRLEGSANPDPDPEPDADEDAREN